eukprot:CAMPEP_0176427424 /NCGR_PEP_ID=MMETSP0127-20121128/12555_1 /TAXON_ID=938130 /ORGANISM="Platyophrya macrostoma, Strain WH" /LENGTH=115 /DNA_ID=CAMNT_0017808931 /DNA_START=182 /DNA_END=525 /DNA_ORIENTATION=+
MWLLRRIDTSSGGTFFTTGKIIEEVPSTAPRIVEVGSHSMMVGVEDGLIGMRSGGRRLVFVSPKKTRVSGIGNPEVGASDSVVVMITVHDVLASESLGGVDEIAGSEDDIVTASG